jgi:hypothetical protein
VGSLLCEGKRRVSTRAIEKDEGGTMLPCAREKTKWRVGFSMKGEEKSRSDGGERRMGGGFFLVCVAREGKKMRERFSRGREERGKGNGLM